MTAIFKTGNDRTGERVDQIKILYADETEKDRIKADNMMRELDVDCTCVSGPSEAIKEVMKAGGDYDCVILDIHMGGMGGIEAGRLIRHKYRNLPIVMITEGACLETELAARTLGGCCHLMTKPLDSAQLESVLDTVVPGTKLEF